jgi:hypothetical protein
MGPNAKMMQAPSVGLNPSIRNAASGVSADTRGVGSAERQGANGAGALLKHLSTITNKPAKPVQRSGIYPPAKGI